MNYKEAIRKRYLLIRKKKYFKINSKFFYPLIKIIKDKFQKKIINISIYYPSFYEVDVLKVIDLENLKKFNFLLPIIERNNAMNFYRWKKNDILFVNRFGLLEPQKSLKKIPDIVLLPLIAFDKNKNRIGYGKGFFDKYLNRFIKNHKKILTIGVAFSFQKHHNLPVNDKDYKLDYIITEKGLI